MIAAGLIELSSLLSLKLDLVKNQLGPGPQASLEGAKGLEVPVPLSLGVQC